MDTDDAEPLLEVHLLQVPVPLWARAREHSDELQREFALMAMTADRSDVPARLLALVRHLRTRYGQASSAQEQQLQAASEHGVEVLDDLRYVLPASAADASAQVSALYDEADEHCRTGEHLLTLATPEDLVAFRRWFLGEFVRQGHGQPPMPWPQYRAP